MYECSGEQWEYIGQCEECGAGLYAMDSRIKPSCAVESGHLCYIRDEEDADNRIPNR